MLARKRIALPSEKQLQYSNFETIKQTKNRAPPNTRFLECGARQKKEEEKNRHTAGMIALAPVRSVQAIGLLQFAYLVDCIVNLAGILPAGLCPKEKSQERFALCLGCLLKF